MLVIINFFMSLGKVFGCFLVYIFVSPDLKSGIFLLLRIMENNDDFKWNFTNNCIIWINNVYKRIT